MATYAGHTYTNGCVPTAALAELNPSARHGTSGKDRAYLRADAAAAWNRASVDVQARTGIVLTVRGWNRTLAEQETFFLRNYMPQKAGGYDARTWRGVRYVRRPGKDSVAIPGSSNHGWALAVDVANFGAAGQWDHPRRAKAFPILAEHGFTDTEGRQAHVDEPWHLVYDPTRDRHKDTPAPTPTPPARTPAADLASLETLMAYPFQFAANDSDPIRTVALSPDDYEDIVMPPKGAQYQQAVQGLDVVYGKLGLVGSKHAADLRAKLKANAARKADR